MCQHIFEGRADGVTCRLCGYHMTPEEYAEYLHPSAPEAPTGETQTEPAPKKPRASRKKKEAVKND